MLVFVSSLDFGNMSIAVYPFHLETEVTKTSWTVILSNCYPRLRSTLRNGDSVERFIYKT